MENNNTVAIKDVSDSVFLDLLVKVAVAVC